VEKVTVANCKDLIVALVEKFKQSPLPVGDPSLPGTKLFYVAKLASILDWNTEEEIVDGGFVEEFEGYLTEQLANVAAKKKATTTLKTRLQSLARSVSRNAKMVLNLVRGTPCTDGKQIQLDPNHPFYHSLSVGEWLVCLKAVTCHEAWHCLWTDFKAYADFQIKNKDMPRIVVQTIENALEDGRIEKAGVNDRPGMMKNIQLANELAWKIKTASGQPIQDLLTSLVSRCVCGKDLQGLSDPEVIGLLDKVQPWINAGVNSKTTAECMKYAQYILEEFRPFIKDHMPEAQAITVVIVLGAKSGSVPENNSPSQSPGGGTLVAYVVPSKPEEPNDSKEDSQQPQKGQSGQGSSSASKEGSPSKEDAKGSDQSESGSEYGQGDTPNDGDQSAEGEDSGESKADSNDGVQEQVEQGSKGSEPENNGSEGMEGDTGSTSSSGGDPEGEEDKCADSTSSSEDVNGDEAEAKTDGSGSKSDTAADEEAQADGAGSSKSGGSSNEDEEGTEETGNAKGSSENGEEDEASESGNGSGGKGADEDSEDEGESNSTGGQNDDAEDAEAESEDDNSDDEAEPDDDASITLEIIPGDEPSGQNNLIDEYDEPKDDGGPSDEDSEESADGSSSGIDGSESPESGDASNTYGSSDSEEALPDTPLDGGCDFDNLVREHEEEANRLLREQERLDKRAELAKEEDVDVEGLVRTMKFPGIHDGVTFMTETWDKNPALFRSDVASTKVAQAQFRKVLKPLLKQRFEAPRKRKSGKLVSKKLWRLPALLDAEIFETRRQPSQRFDVVVEILVDCSGSMGCRIPTKNGDVLKDETARKAATALAVVLQELGVMFAVTGFTADFHRGRDVVHCPMVTFGQKDLTGISAIEGRSSNRDGYSIRVAAEELKRRPETVKILMVLSDGWPIACGYSGGQVKSDGCLDTAQAVRQAKKDGLEVVGLYFGPNDENAMQVVNAIYGEDVIAVTDMTYLDGQMGRILKRKLRKYVA
jgi:cobalamin biosynthesis protein CobT